MPLKELNACTINAGHAAPQGRTARRVYHINEKPPRFDAICGNLFA